MHPFVRRTAAVLAAAAATLTLSAGAASAYDRCPRGWDPARTGGDLAGVQQFCEKYSFAGMIPNAFVFKVPADRVSQGMEYLWSGEQETNPWVRIEPVSEWMRLRALAGERWSLMINGTFFDPNVEGDAGRPAFPVYAKDPNGGEVSTLISTGKDTRDEQFPDDRRCISWRRGERSWVKDSAWTLTSNDYFDIVDRLAGIDGQCSMPADGDIAPNGEFVVGFDPRLEVDRGDPNSLVLIGVTTRSGGMWNGSDFCFLVGGWSNRNDASNMLQETFGCKPLLQLDGGRSTQLAFTHPVTGEIKTLIEGVSPVFNRKVPHFLGVR